MNDTSSAGNWDVEQALSAALEHMISRNEGTCQNEGFLTIPVPIIVVTSWKFSQVS